MSVKKIENCPEQFIHMDTGNFEFYSLYDGQGEYGVAAVAWHEDCAELHMEALRWGPRARQGLLRDMGWFKSLARNKGKARIVGLRQEAGDPDPRWPKFTKLFGFEGHAVVQTAFLEL